MVYHESSSSYEKICIWVQWEDLPWKNFVSNYQKNLQYRKSLSKRSLPSKRFDFWRCKITQWWRIEKMCFVRTYCPWEFTSLSLGIEGQKKIEIFQNWKRYSRIFRSWLHQKPSQNPNIQRFHQTTRRMDGIQTPELFLRHDPSSQKINNPTIHHIR